MNENGKRRLRRHEIHCGTFNGSLWRLLTHGAPARRLGSSHECERPLLLLYGFCGVPRMVAGLAHWLERQGRCVIWFDLGGWLGRFNTARIDLVAEAVAREVARSRFRSRLTSIYCSRDSICPPPSCRLDTRFGAHLKNVEFPSGTHLDFLFRKPLLEALRAELVERAPMSKLATRASTPAASRNVAARMIGRGNAALRLDDRVAARRIASA